MADNVQAIIIDGGYETKAGFSKDRLPMTISTTFPCPFDRCIVTNWNDMEKIWHQTFHEALHIAPEEHPVLLTETPLNPKANKEKTVQIMFEQFNVPAMQISTKGQLSLYGTGRTTGIVLESGHTTSHIVPIYKGYCLPHATLRLDFAGSDITDYLTRLLREKGYSNLNAETTREIKEKFAYVSPSYQEQQDIEIVTKAKASHYKLPDGQVISLDRELTQCSEALFHPSRLPLRLDKSRSHPDPILLGIHQSINTSITKCEDKKQLYGNIVLSGGNTLFPGLGERLEKELVSIAPPSSNIRVIAPAERRVLTWIGGANLTSLSSFQFKWTMQEYDESGPSLVHCKVY